MRFKILPLTINYASALAGAAFTATAQLPHNIAIGIVAIIGDSVAAARHDISAINDGATELIQGPAIRSDLILKGNISGGVRVWPALPSDKTPLPGIAAFNPVIGAQLTIRGTRITTGNDFSALYILYYVYGCASDRPMIPELGQPIICNLRATYTVATLITGQEALRIQARTPRGATRLTQFGCASRNDASGAALNPGINYLVSMESSVNTDENVPWRGGQIPGELLGISPANPDGGIAGGIWSMLVPDREQVSLSWQQLSGVAAAQHTDNVLFGYVLQITPPAQTTRA